MEDKFFIETWNELIDWAEILGEWKFLKLIKNVSISYSAIDELHKRFGTKEDGYHPTVEEVVSMLFSEEINKKEVSDE